MGEAEARQYSPLALAFLGDSVYEVMVRSALVREANTSAQKLHNRKIRFVCAAFQARASERLMDTFTEQELAVWHRGRNVGGNPPKNADPADYRKATGFEAVFGYLHLMEDTKRIQELFNFVWSMREELLKSSE